MMIEPRSWRWEITSNNSSAPVFGERHEATFVDDQQVMGGKALLEALEPAVVDGLHAFVE